MPEHLHILGSPLTGVVHQLRDVPDRTFADEMLGPGIAVFPAKTPEITVLAPTAGLIRTIHPHAFILQICEYSAVLVHLGIDTFKADTVFDPLVRDGRYITAQSPITRWNLEDCTRRGFAPWVTLTLLGGKGRGIEVSHLCGSGEDISAGQDLLEIRS